jgi:tetratricopeptide (TPR) repeat protein
MNSFRLFFLIFCMLFAKNHCAVAISPVEVGVQKYQEALQTTDIEKKTALLNEALMIYLAHAAKDPSGKLLSNIGDVYYSFGQYGYAIGYYRKALLLRPGDRLIQHNLQNTIRTAQVGNEQINEPFLEFIGFLGWTPNERGMLALGLILVTLVIFSLNVWLPSFGFAIPWRLGLICTFLYVGPLLLISVFKSATAVALRAAPLRGLNAPHSNITGISVDPGQMLYVENCDDITGYVQVRTVSGVRGDLPKEDIMFIEE